MSENFAEKVRRRRREERRNWTAKDELAWLEDHPDDEPLEGIDLPAAPAPEADSDLVPDIEPYERSAEDLEIDAVIDRIDITDAYNRWANKGTVPNTSKTEGIKVRCPNPMHVDRDPSAWINTNEGLWYCGACAEGGDKFDIAAWGLGFDVPGYKSKDQFPALRRAMAAALGYVVTKSPVTGRTYVSEEAPEPDHGAHPSPGSDAAPEPTATVVEMTPGYVETRFDPSKLGIEWRKFIKDDTFLRRWMEITTVDDLPEEYYFWLGLSMIGLAAGNGFVLADQPAVKGNLYIVLLGASGIGKSRAIQHAQNLLRKTIPYADDVENVGVNIVSGIASAEALLDSFVKIESDEEGDFLRYVPVKGWVRFDELSELIIKSERAGNPMKSMLMELYDGYGPVEHVSRGRGRIRAEGHFVSAITTTQPKALGNLLQQGDVFSGFLNRWIFATGKPKKPMPYGAVQIDTTPCEPELRGIHGRSALSPRRMELKDEALSIWEEFFYDTVLPLKMDEDRGELAVRSDLTLKKLMLLLAIDRRETNPSATTVADAISLWTPVTSAYTYVGSNIGIGHYQACSDRVEEILRAWDGSERSASMRDIKRAIRNRFPDDLVLKVITNLIALGEVEEIVPDRSTRGRPTTRYRWVS